MTREGELTVRLPWDGRRVHAPTVSSTRPLVASRMFAGKSPEQVIAMVPLLFSICGGAQRAAASAALAAAGAEGIVRRAADERGVVLETVQEYFWRLLIDWPQAMGRQTFATPVATARHRIAAAARDRDGAPAFENEARMRELGVELSHIAAKSIYAMASGEWLEIEDEIALQKWAGRETTLPAMLTHDLLDENVGLGRSDVALMPNAPEALLETVVPAMVEPEFAHAPTWNGTPMETGALSRVYAEPLVAALDASHGHAILTRMIARLVELGRLLDGLATGMERADHLPPIQGFALGLSEGLAAVQTARGLLLHRVRLSGTNVEDYGIVAPTEWNFHPHGALVDGLGRLEADDEVVLSRHARLAVQALDPCVACRIEVGHA
jgi:uptake hydrogenase large subunit